MFNKALFKQSCKANGTMWAIITSAICFMLACLMIICGNGNIATMKSSLSDTIIKQEIDAQIDQRSINYYNMANISMNEFSKTFKEDFEIYYRQYLAEGNSISSSQRKASASAYESALIKLQDFATNYAKELGYNENSTESMEILAVMIFAFAPTEEFQKLYTDNNETYATAEEIITLMFSSNNEAKKDEIVVNSTSVFIASQMTNPENISLMLEQVKKYDITEEKFNTFELTYKNIKKSSTKTILTYKVQLDYEVSLLNRSNFDSDENYNEAIKEISEKLSKEFTGSLLSTLPESVASGIEELGQMDLFEMVIGSIFYKLAGLLLPIIYIIMVSNNLIAGQVDSGSMAYVLSTSTKRSQVVFTQAIFLIGSLFAMLCCLTLTSVICLSFITIKTIGYGKLILLNLGAFITLFAISGLCFFTSCWFDRSKKSMSIGGGLSMFFLVASMLGLFGTKILPSIVRLDSLNFFNYVSIISLFDTISINAGTLTFLWKLAILVILGSIGYIIGSIRFKKKDLPL